MYSDHIISQKEHNLWFDNILENKTKKYLIYELDGKPVGLAGFTEINSQHNTAMWAYYIGEDGTPKGTGQKLEKLTLDYAFNTLKLRKLSCEVIASNERVIHIHKKYGFQIEGNFKQHIIKDGVRVDVIRFAIFQEEWQKLNGYL